MIARILAVAWVATMLAGCTCGGDRKARREDAGTHHRMRRPEKNESAPPPPAVHGENASTQGGDPRFGGASITIRVEEGQPRATVAVVIPPGSSVQDGATQRASVYFDHGPPIGAALTAREGSWRSEELRLPSVVSGAHEATLKIPTVPQTTFKWDVSAAWERAASGPVTVETTRGAIVH